MKRVRLTESGDVITEAEEASSAQKDTASTHALAASTSALNSSAHTQRTPTAASTPSSGKQLFVKTKEGKLVRLPDNAESLRLLSKAKVIKSVTTIPAEAITSSSTITPPVQKQQKLELRKEDSKVQKLSLVGAQKVSPAAVKAKNLAGSNLSRVDELCKMSKFYTARRKVEPHDSRQTPAKASPYVSKLHDSRQEEELEDSDDDEVEGNALPNDVETELSKIKKPGVNILSSLVQGVHQEESKRVQRGDRGWSYHGSEPLAVAELLLYALLHYQGALLHYTPEKRLTDQCTIERCYNALSALNMHLPGDLDSLADYLAAMDDPAERKVGKIGAQRRWKYFIDEIQQLVSICSKLLCKLLQRQWTAERSVKLLVIARTVRSTACSRLSGAPQPTGRLNGASLKHILSQIETKLHKVLEKWHVRYINSPEMVLLSRTMYNTTGSELQVITVTLCILPSLLCELRINDRAVDFLQMGFSCVQGPLEHVDDITALVQRIEAAYVCTGFPKTELKTNTLQAQTRGGVIYKENSKKGIS